VTSRTSDRRLPERSAAEPRARAESPQAAETRAWALPAAVWPVALLTLALWVSNRLGAFRVWTTVVGPDGVARRLPETFATVDHPFHAARGEVLRRSLLDGDLLRWIANHQGGYPVEFYPLGVAWLEVGVWALSFGVVPIGYAHKLVIVAVFLLPGLAYWLLARRDGWGGVVAFAALTAHVAVPGGWWHGGYTELVLWGLVTNVAGAVAMLFVLWGLVEYVNDGARPAGAVAALAVAFAVATNPRSLVALAVVGAGVWLAATYRGADEGPHWSLVTRRLALVAGIAGALAAPELISLARFSDLYYFVRYEFYDGVGEFVDSTTGAVSPPVAVLAALGVVLGLALPRRPATRAAAVTLALYVGATVVLSAGRDEGFFQQLEATRLMPFQRLLMVYLAAVALVAGARALCRRRQAVADVLAATAAVGLLVAYVYPVGPIHAEREGLVPVLSAASASQADFLDAVEVADAVAPSGQALLFLGTAPSLAGLYQWHQPLWAPLETDRPLFYNDWLWYWQTRHAGPYDYHQGHHYPQDRMVETLERDYLDRHGIGAVVVTGQGLQEAAATVPYLERVRDGLYEVYRVADPAPIVSFPGGTTTTVEIGNERIIATGESQGGEAKIGRNWYPRWRATVNGEDVPVTRTVDGYMAVPVPVGPTTIELTYAVDGWDWLARLLALGGLAGTIWLAAGGFFMRRRRMRPAPRA
jgi:hypothetical protein